MIDNYLLEELVTFAQEKTLGKTAEKLMVTQPTVTRGMQKLEDELGVQLFDRQPNKITLTKTGKVAAKNAAIALAANEKFIQTVQNYAASQTTVKIAGVAPGPVIVAHQVNANSNSQLAVSDQFVNANEVDQLLTSNQFSLLITNQEIQTEAIESLYLGDEQLFVNLDQFTYLANSQQVSFNDLAGLSFIVLSDIGPWKQIIQEQIPNAKFLYQEQWESLSEISKYSNFPYFSTNITQVNTDYQRSADEDRVTLPITDQAANMTFFISYLKSHKRQLTPVINSLQQAWPTLNERKWSHDQKNFTTIYRWHHRFGYFWRRSRPRWNRQPAANDARPNSLRHYS